MEFLFFADFHVPSRKLSWVGYQFFQTFARLWKNDKQRGFSCWAAFRFASSSNNYPYTVQYNEKFVQTGKKEKEIVVFLFHALEESRIQLISQV
jgi:hypothetical protein